MLDSMFTSVFGTSEALVGSVSSIDFLLCCGVSIALGCLVALIYMFKHNYSKNFVVTLALLPLIVQMVITLVNGNIGAGIAVGAGAPAAIGALTEDPKSFGKALIFVALGEGIALYGMLVSILILARV